MIYTHTLKSEVFFTFEYGLSDLDVKKVCLRSYFFHNTSTISLVPDDIFSLINFQKRKKKKLRLFFRNTSQHSTIGTREASRGISHKNKIIHREKKKKRNNSCSFLHYYDYRLKQKEIKALYDFQYVGLNSKTFRKTAILSCNDVHHFALVS